MPIMNETISGVLRHVAATTGLEQGDFSISLFTSGVVSGQSVTIAEVGNGVYSYSFLPNAVGLWQMIIIVTAESDVAYQGAWEVTETLNDVSLDDVIGAVSDAIEAAQPITADLTHVNGVAVTLDDFQTDLSALETLADTAAEQSTLVRKIVENNVVIDGETGAYSIYDDDGLTAISAGIVTELTRTKDT